MPEFENNPAANTILNLLAASEVNYDYPALQNDAVEKISTNISEFIYTSLKQKSNSSSYKRCNLLKFLNNICKTSEFHLGENHYKVYLKGYEREFHKTHCPEAECLSHIVASELEDFPLDVHNEVLNFYKRKNARRKDKIKKQEFIKQLDQEKASLISGMPLSRSVSLSHYETSRSLIDDLLKGSKDPTIVNNNRPIAVQLHSRGYRERQVKFCYALINIGRDDSDMKMLESILDRYSTYDVLESFEINLLIDLWVLGDCHSLNLCKIITEKYPFIIEKLVIQFCTSILSLKNSSDVNDYFSSLIINPKIIRLRDVCTKNLGFYCKLKNLIFELYVFSYCNENVYKFSDYII